MYDDVLVIIKSPKGISKKDLGGKLGIVEKKEDSKKDFEVLFLKLAEQ